MSANFRLEFLQLAVERGVLRFGEFTLKSGRVSPYFFNAGLFHSGEAIARVGRYYAEAIVSSGVKFDVLFGPAYKGIPLAAVTAAALYDRHGLDVPWAYNRKESKAHGEGGQLVGAPLIGRVLVIDDVITAGTAIRESAELIERAGARLAGVVIALDRQERGQGSQSAVQEVEQSFNIPVIRIASLSDLVEFITVRPDMQGFLPVVREYRAKYGIAMGASG